MTRIRYRQIDKTRIGAGPFFGYACEYYIGVDTLNNSFVISQRYNDRVTSIEYEGGLTMKDTKKIVRTTLQNLGVVFNKEGRIKK